ncbi:hypothetical protein [Miniimonas sp. S16]|uniref:hypothetical protein n=1 Tax=Miniimonas sp. S16 TaxID=2171623 RepID=UPI000D529931|nr:hypothetical protein [Miniimonas sp. S16]
MILGDLLDAHVVTHDGEELGRVVDLRLSLEVLEEGDGSGGGPDEAEPGGPDEREHGSGNADDQGDDGDTPLVAQTHRSHAVGSADVVGLLVSPHTGGSFLGFERRGVRSPWVVAALVRWRHRGTFLVAWHDVERISPGLVHLVPGFEKLDPTLDEGEDA